MVETFAFGSDTPFSEQSGGPGARGPGLLPLLLALAFLGL